MFSKWGHLATDFRFDDAKWVRHASREDALLAELYNTVQLWREGKNVRGAAFCEIRLSAEKKSEAPAQTANEGAELTQNGPKMHAGRLNARTQIDKNRRRQRQTEEPTCESPARP